MIVVFERNGDLDEWDRFDTVSDHPANLAGFAAIYDSSGAEPMFLEATLDGEPVAHWLVGRAKRRRLDVRWHVQAYTGPQVRSLWMDRYDEIFEACVRFLVRKRWASNVDVLSYALTRDVPRTALELAGFRRIECFETAVNDLGGNDEDLLRCFHENHRTNVRKAAREGLRYRTDLRSNDYLALAEAMREATKSDPEPYALPPAAMVRAVEASLAPKRCGFLSGVHGPNGLEAASIIVHGASQGFYWFGASARQKHRGATALLHFENMRELRARGVRRYDFGGGRHGEDASPKARSISAFKLKFGGRILGACGGCYR